VDGKAAVVRNGSLPDRELQTGVGPVTVRIPKVRSKTGDQVIFRSALVPPYVRKTKSPEAAQHSKKPAIGMTGLLYRTGKLFLLCLFESHHLRLSFDCSGETCLGYIYDICSTCAIRVVSFNFVSDKRNIPIY